MIGREEKPVQLLCLGNQTDELFSAVFSAAIKSKVFIINSKQIEFKDELGNMVIRDHSEIKEEETVNIPLFDTAQTDILLLLPKSIEEFKYLCIYALSRTPRPPHTLSWVALINSDREKINPHYNEIAKKYSISLIQGRFSDNVILTLLNNIIVTFYQKPQDLLNAQLNTIPSEREALKENIFTFFMGQHKRLGKNSAIYEFSKNKIYAEKDLLPIIFDFSYGSLWHMSHAPQTKQKTKLENEEKTEKTVSFKA